MRTGKWTMMAAVVLLAGTLTARAWEPRGWVYFDWPYAYDNTSGTWIYFNATDTQWCYGSAPAGGWVKLKLSGLASGWSYHAWPYAYDSEGGAWYYMEESDTQWCFNLVWTEWSELEACAGGFITDCTAHCAPAGFIGNGLCDEGYRGTNFNCAAFGYDAGDCVPLPGP